MQCETNDQETLTVYQTPILLIGHSMGGLVIKKVPCHCLWIRGGSELWWLTWI